MQITSLRSWSRLAGSAFLAFVLALIWVGCGDTPDSVVGPVTGGGEAGSLGKAAQQVQAVMAVQVRHTDELMAKRGVVGTATGLGPSGQLAVVVFTRGDEDVGSFPLRVDGVPLVIEQVGEIVALQAETGSGKPTGKPGGGKGDGIDPTSRFPHPVPIGVSTGNEGECSAGTIGCRVKSGTTVYALSNNHVYALENSAPIGSDVLQPGRYDTNCSIDPDDVIGTLAVFEPIVFSTSANNKIDAAIALSSTANLGNATPSNGYGVPNSTTVSASVGLAVQKYGRTTSLTKGQVTGVNATVKVGYTSGTARFVGQIIVQARRPFLKAGDSGSLLVTDNANANPVGLLFAGTQDGKLAVANQIGEVLSKLNVAVDGK